MAIDKTQFRVNFVYKRMWMLHCIDNAIGPTDNPRKFSIELLKVTRKKLRNPDLPPEAIAQALSNLPRYLGNEVIVYRNYIPFMRRDKSVKFEDYAREPETCHWFDCIELYLREVERSFKNLQIEKDEDNPKISEIFASIPKKQRNYLFKGLADILETNQWYIEEMSCNIFSKCFTIVDLKKIYGVGPITIEMIRDLLRTYGCFLSYR